MQKNSGSARSFIARPSASRVQTPLTGTPVLTARPRAVANPDPDADERARPAPDRESPHLPPTSTHLRRALHLSEQGGRVPRASVGREAERRLVQHLAAAHRADGGVGSRRVEADDRLALGAQLSQ